MLRWYNIRAEWFETLNDLGHAQRTKFARQTSSEVKLREKVHGHCLSLLLLFSSKNVWFVFICTWSQMVNCYFIANYPPGTIATPHKKRSLMLWEILIKINSTEIVLFGEPRHTATPRNEKLKEKYVRHFGGYATTLTDKKNIYLHDIFFWLTNILCYFYCCFTHLKVGACSTPFNTKLGTRRKIN